LSAGIGDASDFGVSIFECSPSFRNIEHEERCSKALQKRQLAPAKAVKTPQNNKVLKLKFYFTFHSRKA
jgi:hypothetical protein